LQLKFSYVCLCKVMTLWPYESIYLIILSLKHVILRFVVVPHGSLLFPSFLELALVVANLVSLCLHFGVLYLHETVQILAIALLLGSVVHVA